MEWHGVVVSEALTDESVVNRLRVTGARIDGGRHRYWVATGEDGIALVRRYLRSGPWYAHFWCEGRLLVIFSDACVRLGPGAAEPALRTHAARHGLTAEDLDLSTAPAPCPERLGGEDASGPLAGRAAQQLTAPQADPAPPLRLVLADEEVDTLLDTLEQRFFAPLAAERSAAAPQRALRALRAVREALARPRPARVLAPNGRWVHAGLQLAALDPVNVEELHAALRAMSAALVGAARPGDGYAAALDRSAARAGCTPRALTGALARLLAVVDLPPDEDTRALEAALRAAPEGDLVLDAAREQAFQRLAHRVSMLLTEADPLHRFLLRPEPPGP